MHTRLLPAAVVAIFLLGTALLPSRALAEAPTATPTATATSMPPRFFNVRLQTKNLDKPVGPLQELQGKVVGKTGAGVDGVVVRAFSTDWQAFETTKDGGKFKFSLSLGSYTVQLVDMVAQETKLTIDGKTELGVEFYEVESLPSTPTPLVAAASPTATATATATTTETATPSPTLTPPPLPVASGEAITIVPTPVPTAATLPFPTEIDPGPWLQALLFGVALGGGMVVFGLAVSLVRRL